MLEACHRSNEKSLRLLAKGKCERIRDETYGRKDYISQQNILNTRNHYRTRYSMQPFAGNYSKDRRFARSSWLCHCKELREEESHHLSGHCTVYGDLTLKYSDLTYDKSLVQFCNEVLARRDALDKMKTTQFGVGDTIVGANHPILDTMISVRSCVRS